ncbi:FecR domain-containing protein [Tunicatimonas pelagia]|uniref:FecR domain-containing protein n=1 Tax=Tunicatimonas pelagia TaxID=931531 RepID=UPI0026662DA2|nr:FecR domain-containing protein [Tunicatimonas pelagia]WKN43167.1 FecR domain-containing protein [Tunicatimonas pelagia]
MNHLAHQLINNPSFERWVRDPDNNQQDAEHWQQWLDSNPEHTEAVAEARALLLQISFQQQPVSAEQITDSWHNVSQRIATSETKTIRPLWLRWQYAASVSLLVCASVVVWYWLSGASTVYDTAYGETQAIELEDGTQVVLNGNSQLTIARNWLNKTQREVFLEGEAYFSVNRRTQNEQLVPFKVHTSNLRVKVLGTQFNVNSRRGQTQVVLDEGKVTVDIPEKEEATMQPGDYVMYSSESKEVTHRQVNPDIYTSWRKQQLILDDTPVSRIIRQLEDTYGVEFVLANEAVRHRRISSTGSISTEDLETVLIALSTLLQVKIEQENNVIYLYEN